MKSNEFISAVLAYLAETQREVPVEITQDTDLIDTGIVDSFSITQLILFIEDTLGIEIDLDDPTLDSIRTVRRMDLSYNAQRELT